MKQAFITAMSLMRSGQMCAHCKPSDPLEFLRQVPCVACHGIKCNFAEDSRANQQSAKLQNASSKAAMTLTHPIYYSKLAPDPLREWEGTGEVADNGGGDEGGLWMWLTSSTNGTFL